MYFCRPLIKSFLQVRKKTKRFEDNARSYNVVEPGQERYEKMKGQWHAHFQNQNPITLELACGRGEYTVGLAAAYPERNYIGIDVKGDRIWKGAQHAQAAKLDNAGFLRTQILMLEYFFNPGEVDEIYIVFPDPRPKKRDVHRRLTFARFIDMYKRILAPGGLIHLKTDNTGLFEYTLETVRQREDLQDLVYTHNLYTSPLLEEHLGIKTKYEKLFTGKGENIKYMRFKLDPAISTPRHYKDKPHQIPGFHKLVPPQKYKDQPRGNEAAPGANE